jgi:hypothetical protein
MVLSGRLSGLIIFALIIFQNVSEGQQVPFDPISYRIFTPFIFNPAISGSKDFSSTDLVASIQGSSKSQTISWNTRLSKKVPGYFLSPAIIEYWIRCNILLSYPTRS